MAAARTSALLKKVHTLAGAVNERPLELAEVLFNLRALGADAERPTFADLIELTKLSRRTLGYLISVWERFGDLDVPNERLSRVGWMKLAIIAEKCEPGKEFEGLALAETCTVKELPALLLGKKKKPKMHSILLRLTDDQYRAFANVLVAHGAKRPKRGRGVSGKERALMKALGQIWA